MYYYLYDSSLSDKKYYNTLARIETRLTDLGINGKINRLSFLKNIKQILNDEIRRGIKTIVIVGNDKTIGQVINLVADLNITIGIIPVGEASKIAELLAIPAEERACDILSARIIKRVDLGRINNYYFFTSVEIGGGNISLKCDNNYFISLEGKNNIINVSNLNSYHQIIAKPDDGLLDVFIESTKRNIFGRAKTSFSHLTNREIRITSNKILPVLLNDEKRIIKTPADIEVVPKKIRLIVGKNRKF